MQCEVNQNVTGPAAAFIKTTVITGTPSYHCSTAFVRRQHVYKLQFCTFCLPILPKIGVRGKAMIA